MAADDLFGWSERRKPYPGSPGWKEDAASKDAAKKMEPRAGTLRAEVLAAFAASPGGLTADEAADVVDATVLAVRPRVTELSKLKLITKTTARRKNASGMGAAVWKLRDRQ